MARKQQELNYETKVEILKAYQNREIKAHEIPKMFGISQSVMQKVVLELGGALREPNKAGKRGNSGKLCPKCRRKVEGV